MAQHLDNSTMPDYSTFPNGECCPNWKMGKSCFWNKKLNPEELRLAWADSVLKWNKESNREMFLANAENPAILTLEYRACSPPVFRLKERNFHDNFRSYRTCHFVCLISSFITLPPGSSQNAP
jgi:hypothetical protein